MYLTLMYLTFEQLCELSPYLLKGKGTLWHGGGMRSTECRLVYLYSLL